MAAADFVDQDGFSPGTLSALEIDTNGFLNGVFSNGVTTSLAQVVLANFGNVEGLTEIGGSRLIDSVQSGAPSSPERTPATWEALVPARSENRTSTSPYNSPP